MLLSALFAVLASAIVPDPDFALQGEYLGIIHAKDDSIGAPLGAQVVAQGEGAFKIVFFPGGLPGAGAAGERYLVQGTRAGAVLAFADSLYAGGISGDTLKGLAGPEAAFTLVKRTRVSSTLGLRPPAEATVLFGGGEPDAFPPRSHRSGARELGGALPR